MGQKNNLSKLALSLAALTVLLVVVVMHGRRRESPEREKPATEYHSLVPGSKAERFVPRQSPVSPPASILRNNVAPHRLHKRCRRLSHSS